MKTCAFITLGCKVNQYETQAIRESLAAKGFIETTPEKPADLYVINTCTVTSVSDEKSRHYIRKIKRKNPASTVVVTGCYAEAEVEAVKKMEGVDFVITKSEEPRLADIVSNRDGKSRFGREIKNMPSDENSIFDLKISNFKGHTKAFLKIEDGCDVYCSYCIIPYVRGSVRSRSLKDIKEEAERLIQNGYKEIILTGIHLGAYGKDTSRKHHLLDVIYMLSNLSGFERLRLSSIEVNEITNELIEFVACSKKMCPHFHIPLQSGDDFILKRMNRKYTASQYLEILANIRSKIDLPSLTTDVMVGFPGEKDVHFENTISLCKKAGFSRMHIFSFSSRDGTPAARMPDHCSPQAIKQRKTKLETVANNLAFAYKEQFLNKPAEVLVEAERDAKTNKLCGYSERYIRVLFDGTDTMKNTIVFVRVEDANPSFCTGTLSDSVR